jgi:hypothetical protein
MDRQDDLRIGGTEVDRYSASAEVVLFDTDSGAKCWVPDNFVEFGSHPADAAVATKFRG